MKELKAAEYRQTCERCRRPSSVCYCAHLPSLPTRTRVYLLQHPRERDMAIGTARMAHLSLPSSSLHVATEFSSDRAVGAALDGERASYLLFPGPTTVDAGALADTAPINLFVVDGTWAQAKKLIRLNPRIAALPRIGFFRAAPSDYRIRKQPEPFCVSTIEALYETLRALEPEGADFSALMTPFRAMVDRQQWFVREIQSGRHRRAVEKKRARRRPTLSERLTALWPRLVCVHGEANGWSRRDPARQDPETVHWVAHRVATGETFERVIAPRRMLAPSTPAHIGIDADTLARGISRERWCADWDAFVRPDDVFVKWGDFYRALAVADGLRLSSDQLDVRIEVMQALRARCGTLEECVARVEAPPRSLGLLGRGGDRLAMLSSVMEVLRARS